MLKRVIIQNYQSHKKTILDFSEGINCIIGPSNKGKSAILRAILWNMRNRPIGADYISHRNLDEKGQPIKPTYCSIQIGDTTIIRIRSNSINGYRIKEGDKENELEAIDKGVPEQVENLFNMEEVNVQKQMDAPFMLSESAGDVARFFNKIIRLDLIDRVLQKAEAKKRECKRSKEDAERNLKQMESIVEEYEWTEDAQRLIDTIKGIVDKINAETRQVEDIDNSIDSVQRKLEEIKGIDGILSAINIVNNIDSKINIINDIEDDRCKILEQIESYKKSIAVINELTKIESAIPIINKIDDILASLGEMEKKFDSIEESIQSYNMSIDTIENADTIIDKLQKELPDRCPLCGAAIKQKGGKCESNH